MNFRDHVFNENSTTFGILDELGVTELSGSLRSLKAAVEEITQSVYSLSQIINGFSYDIGNMKIQISNMQEVVNRVETLANNVNQRVIPLENKITEISTKIDENNAQVEALTKRFAYYDGVITEIYDVTDRNRQDLQTTKSNLVKTNLRVDDAIIRWEELDIKWVLTIVDGSNPWYTMFTQDPVLRGSIYVYESFNTSSAGNGHSVQIRPYSDVGVITPLRDARLVYGVLYRMTGSLFAQNRAVRFYPYSTHYN